MKKSIDKMSFIIGALVAIIMAIIFGDAFGSIDSGDDIFEEDAWGDNTGLDYF